MTQSASRAAAAGGEQLTGWERRSGVTGATRSFVRTFCISLSALCFLLAALSFMLAAREPAFAGASLPLQRVNFGLLSWILLATGIPPLGVLPLIRAQRREWERIFDLVLGQGPYFYKMLAGSAILVLAELSLPALMAYIVRDIVNTRQDTRLLIVMFGVLVAVLLLRALAGFYRSYYSQGIAYRMTADLRNRIYAHLQKLSFAFFDRSRQGDLMSRITNDTSQLQFFVSNASEDFFVAPLKVLGGLACVFYINPQLAAIIVAIGALSALIMKLLFQRMRRINNLMQRLQGDLTAHLAEGINTIRLAQSFGLERGELGKFVRTNGDALTQSLRFARIFAVLVPTFELLGLVGPLVIIAILCFQAVAQGQTLEADKLLAIVGYGALVANPLAKVGRIVGTLSFGEASSARISAILDTEPDITDAPGAQAIESCDGRIEFDGIGLNYQAMSLNSLLEPAERTTEAAAQAAQAEAQRKWALRDITLTIEPGQVVAFVGESGSGKSSIINLLPRFYEASSGRILLDGRDIRELELAGLRRQLAVVSQETILVHGTVRENIAYGTPGADEKDIVDAAMSANAHSFIMEMREGYDTLVGEKGVTLSGGQRQRIAIARALLRDPRILLLDEATSALDSVAEAVVQDALNKLMYGRTTLVVAHRLSTVRHADLIVVLSEGRIVERGSHDELMASGKEYARLVHLQGLA